jgi:hypothetical protein
MVASTLNIRCLTSVQFPNSAQQTLSRTDKAIVMKKFIVPGLLMLFALGLSQQEAKAGFSIDISIGDNHRRVPPPVVISRPPIVVARPPVVVYQPRQDDCDRGPVYVRECDHDRRRHYRYDNYRYEPRRDSHGRR